MKKETVFLLSGALAAGIGIYAFTQGNITFADKTETAELPSAIPIISQIELRDSMDEWGDGKISIHGSYADGVQSLEELKTASEAILTGTVTEQKQFSSLSVVSTVKVTTVIKGSTWDMVEIYQLGRLPYEAGTELLKPEGEYVLFLGLQGTERENKFYVKGGFQGAFLNSNGEIYNQDHALKEDARKSPSPLTTDLSEFDAFADWLKEA